MALLGGIQGWLDQPKDEGALLGNREFLATALMEIGNLFSGQQSGSGLQKVLGMSQMMDQRQERERKRKAQEKLGQVFSGGGIGAATQQTGTIGPTQANAAASPLLGMAPEQRALLGAAFEVSPEAGLNLYGSLSKNATETAKLQRQEQFIQQAASNPPPGQDPQQWAAFVRLNPEKAMEFAYKPKSPKDNIITVGNTVLDATTMRPIFQAPKDPEPAFGNSAESRAVDYLIRTGRMTQEQAAAWLAGKTVTGPNGQMDFLTPFQVPAAGGSPTVPAGSPVPQDPGAVQPVMGAAGAPGLQSLRAPVKPEEKPLSAEAAARVALVKEGVKAVDGVRSVVLGPDGKSINRTAIASMWSGIPGSEGSQIRNLIENAIGNRLRIETGAAATAEETNKLLNRYLPKPWDNEATVKQKLDGLRQYFAEFEALTRTPTSAPPNANPAPAGSGIIRFDAEGNRIQ